MSRGIHSRISPVFFLLLILIPGEAKIIRLIFTGDLMLGRGIAQAIRSGDRENPFSSFNKDLSRANYVLGNLESPIGSLPSSSTSLYNLCSPPSAAEILELAGFDLLSLANNHANDCDSHSGQAATRLILAQHNIDSLIQDYQFHERIISGTRFVFMAFDAVTQSLDLERVCNTVSNYKDSRSVIVISLHWGNEYQSAPSLQQEQIAQSLANSGASIIWGHHSHVLQPIRQIWGNGSASPTLVFYSLGNTLFDQHGLRDVNLGAMVEVSFLSTTLVDYRIIPLSIVPQTASLREPTENEITFIYQRLNFLE